MAVAEKHQTDRVRPAAWLKPILGPFLIFLIVTGFYWKLVLSDQYTWLAGNDTAYQVLPWFQFQAGEWHAGRIPLWDPNQWAGQPLIGQGQPGVAYPFNWLLFAQKLDGGWIRQSILHWYFVLIHFMAALFCYWLCRDLRRSRFASIVAGSVFAFCGYMGTTDWPQMINGAVWAPLIFMFLLRVERGEKPILSAALSGAALGFSFLSGHHQAPIYLTLASGCVWLWMIFRRGRPAIATIKYSVIFSLFLVLFSAFQVLPMLEYGKLAARWAGAPEPLRWSDKVPYGVHTQYSLSGSDLLAVVLPGIDQTGDPYMGVVALTLALVAVFCLWRLSQVRILALVGIGGLLFALGANNVFHGLSYALIPMVEKARTPAQAILIFNFAFSTLTAFGIDALQQKENEWRRFVPAVAGFGAFLLLINVFLIVTRQPLTDDRIITVGFVSLLFAAALLFFRRGRIGARPLLGGTFALILIELSLVSTWRLPGRFKPEWVENLTMLSRHGDIADFLRQQKRPFRIEVDDKVIPYNFGDWYGLEDSAGYLASVTNNMLFHDPFSYRMRNMLGVTYLIANSTTREGWTEVYRSPVSGIRVFANPAAFPRTWTVHEAATVNSQEDLRRLVQTDGFDLRRSTVLLGSAPKMDRCSAEDHTAVPVHVSNRVEVVADMACDGMVIVADPWYPGWKAAVDGTSVPIFEAYGVFRGVSVPAGRHKITMNYRPDSVLIGGGMSLAGVIGLLFLSFWYRKRRI